VEVVPFSLLDSVAALMPVGAAVVAGGASGVLVVLAVMGAAGAAPVVSGVPPALGAQLCQELW
jgi:dihydrodipicolinate synthase/N-acetylneuraminate lyase